MAFLKTKDGESVLLAYWLQMVAAAIAAILGYGLYVYPEQGKWHGMLEAFFIAALLTVTVDPVVKSRLAHEVTKDIFYHIIGFRLPEEMQDRLRKYLRDLKYYRKSLSITVKALRIENDEVVFEVSQVSKIVALTKCTYRQSLTFEEAEGGEVIDMRAQRVKSKDTVEWLPSRPWDVMNPEPMTKRIQGSTAVLGRGDEVIAFFTFTFRGRKTGHWVQKFGTTTIKTDVTLVPLDGMKMFASELTHVPLGTRGEYDRVFIVGEDIQIRWKVEDRMVFGATASRELSEVRDRVPWRDWASAMTPARQ